MSDLFLAAINKLLGFIYKVNSLQSSKYDSGQTIIILQKQTGSLNPKFIDPKRLKKKVQNTHHLNVPDRCDKLDNSVNSKCAQRDPSKIPQGRLKVGTCPEVCSNWEWIAAFLNTSH